MDCQDNGIELEAIYPYRTAFIEEIWTVDRYQYESYIFSRFLDPKLSTVLPQTEQPQAESNLGINSYNAHCMHTA